MIKKSFFPILWGLLLLLIPFTSLPLASKLLHSEMVAAPSIIPLIILCIFWFVPFFWKNNLISSSKPILLFYLVAILTTLLAFYISTPLQKSFNIYSNAAEGIISLLIGISFYLISSHYVKNKHAVNSTVKLITVGFVPIFIWSFFQFIYLQFSPGYPDWMVNFQKLFTTSGLLFRDRITGFAYEPSWLAHQLNMFYLPIFLSATYTGYSSFRRKIFIFSVENILLFCSIFLLIFTKSRIGWLTFFFCLGYVLLRINRNFIYRIRTNLVSFNTKFWKHALPILFIFLYLIAFIIGIGLLSKIDKRMQKVFDPDTYKNRSVLSIANDFLFAERILYWQTGWNIFNDHPIIGVGLGNSGFYFEKYVPSFAYALDEPRDLLFRADYQANNKNFWTRLLSETGIIGFILFITWILFLWAQSNKLEKGDNKIFLYWGMVGKIALIAFLFEGFSIDSFALPYYWLIFGLLSAVFRISENKMAN